MNSVGDEIRFVIVATNSTFYYAIVFVYGAFFI